MSAAPDRSASPLSRELRVTSGLCALLIGTFLMFTLFTFLSPSPALGTAVLGGRAIAPVGAPEPRLSAAEVTADTTPEIFWALDWGTSTYGQIEATARYVGEHCVVYADDAVLFHNAWAEQLGTAFDTTIYPALTEAYGSEPDPGIDGEPRIAILIYDFHKDIIEGSFRERDIDPRGSTTSNEREMFYLNLQSLIADIKNVGALAAHEFAHLILYYRDVMLDPSPYAAAESTWLTEGFTTYAEHLAGYDERVGGQLLAFTFDPSTSVTNWRGWRADYGASYALMSYLAEREGADFIKALVEQPLDGIAGINATLTASASFDTFATLYDDWILANYLDGFEPPCPPYAYSELVVAAEARAVYGDWPLLRTDQVGAWAASYFEFAAADPTAPFQVVVDGADKAPLSAAVISRDSQGVLPTKVTFLDLSGKTAGDTVDIAPGFDRHTLVVWASGTVGSDDSYSFVYSAACDPPAGVQFLDMGGGDIFYPYVAELLMRGVVSGKEIPTGSGLWFYAGGENVLRQQFTKMIMESIGLHTSMVDNLTDPTFSDVRPVYDDTGWPLEYPYDYIEEAAGLGIINGYAGGVFKPYAPITRSQLVLMIVRAATAAGTPLPEYTGSEKKFVDVPLSHPRYRQIMTAYTAGVLSGSQAADGRWYFYPDSPASRNHVAKMTAVLCGLLDE